MLNKYFENSKTVFWGTIGLCLLAGMIGCTQKPPEPGVKRMEPGKEFSGFLKDYSNLKPNPKLEGEALTYANPDKMKSLRRYVAIIVDPVEVYVSTTADLAGGAGRARETVSNYLRNALMNAVSDAYPVVDSPGPLVLRLRAAVVGVDTGGPVAPVTEPELTAKPLEKAIVLEKVGVEMELVDSESGERIAAMVDRTNLGAGAQVGDENFSRMERFREAKHAFDEWAGRVRTFLDTENELTGEDADRADKAYRPYGQ